MSAATATASDEQVVGIRSGAETIVAVATEPLGAFSGLGVLVVGGAPFGRSSQRNGWATRVCRQLAGHGIRGLRIDWHGIGESSGILSEEFALEPFVSDVDAAVRWLSDSGADRVFVVGRCLGAWAAITAASGLESIAGLVMLAPQAAWGDASRGREQHQRKSALQRTIHRRDDALMSMMRRTARRLHVTRARRSARLGPGLVSPLTVAAKREVPILIVHCELDPASRAFAEARDGRHGSILGAPRVRLATLPGGGGLLERIDRQEQSLELVIEWIVTHMGTGPRVSP